MVGGLKLNLVLMDQMKNEKHNGRGSIGATPKNLLGGQERWASLKPLWWDVGEIQGCIHQYVARNVTAKE